MQSNRARSNLGHSAVALAVCATIALAACGDDTGTADTGTVVTKPVETPSTTVITSPVGWAATECVWRWYDRWDVTAVVPDGVAVGSTVELRATLFQGDVSTVGAVGSLTVTDPGPQIVELHVPPPTWLNPKEINARRFSDLSPTGGSMCEVSFASEGNPTIGYIDMTSDVDPPGPDGTPLGDLVAAVDTTDAPMLALAELLWLQPEPPFDRLYLAPETTLDAISVERDGTCRSITAHYAAVTVSQQHGCAAPLPSAELPGWVSVAVPDDHWAVTVIGPEADVTALVVALQPIDVPNAETVDGPAIPGSDEWLDGYFADHPVITELARFDWHEGKIAIVGRTIPDSPVDYLEPVIHGVNANYSSTGVPCAEYTIGIASSAMGAGLDAPPGGFAWFIARDPGTTFTVTAPGLPGTVTLQQAPSGEYVGFLDTGEVALQTSQIVVSDAAGNPVPCTQ